MAMVFCRGCGQRVDESATYCPHCGAAQNSEGNSAANATATAPAADYGMMLLALPVIAAMIIWVVVSGMNLLQSPAEIVSMIMFATIIGTAIVASMEASKVGMKTDRKKGTYGPVAWFFILALLWIIGYPVYLYKRKHFGLPNRLIAGLVVAVIFFGSASAMTASIEAQKEEVAASLGLVNAEASTVVTATNEVTEQEEAAFDCAAHPDLASSADATIRHVEKVQGITAKMKLAIEQHEGMVFAERIPEKLVGTCVALAYYYDNSSSPILYTVSEINNGTEWLVVKHSYDRLVAAMMLDDIKKQSEEEAKQKAAAQAQAEQEAKEETDSAPHGVTNAAKDSLSPGLPLSEVKHQDTSIEQIKPSFSCEQATAKIDKMICQSPDLAKWDAKVFDSYKAAMKITNAAQTNQLVNSQKEWIKKRNQCGTNQCIADAYEQRDRELAPWDYE